MLFISLIFSNFTFITIIIISGGGGGGGGAAAAAAAAGGVCVFAVGTRD